MTMIRLSRLTIAGVEDYEGQTVAIPGGLRDVVAVRFDGEGEVGLVDSLDALEDFAADLVARLAAVRARRNEALRAEVERLPFEGARR